MTRTLSARPTMWSMSGPGAGVNGGRIVAEGTPADIIRQSEFADRRISQRRARDHRCRERRAKNPLTALTKDHRRARHQPQKRHHRNSAGDYSPPSPACPAAASRRCSIDTLYKALARRFERRAAKPPARFDRIEGIEHIDKIIDIDQSPIGRTPRSNPATYTGAFTPIREWFAGLPRQKRAATSPAASPSTSRAAAARPARATASSRSRCTSCPTSTSPATSARASATDPRDAGGAVQGQVHRQGKHRS